MGRFIPNILLLLLWLALMTVALTGAGAGQRRTFRSRSDHVVNPAHRLSRFVAADVPADTALLYGKFLSS